MYKIVILIIFVIFFMSCEKKYLILEEIKRVEVVCIEGYKFIIDTRVSRSLTVTQFFGISSENRIIPLRCNKKTEK